MKKKKLLATVVTSVFLASTLLMGCGSKTDNSASGGSSSGVEQVIRLRGYDFTSLDPAQITDSESSTSVTNIFEGLTTERLVDGEHTFVKTGAKSIDVSDDGLTYTIKLNTKVKWSDGKTVTAKDYEYAWKRLTDPNVSSGYVDFLAQINVVNADKVAAGEMDVDELGVKAIDDETLEVKLTAPTPYFEKALSFSSLVPQRQDIVEKLGDKYGQDFEKMVFNGPFIIDEYSKGSKIVYKKNDKYWDADNIKLEEADCTITGEVSTLDQMFQSGELDGVSMSGDYLDDYKEQAKNGDIKEISESGTGTFYMAFNLENKVLNNKNIRIAMALAHDQQSFLDVVYKRNIAAKGFIPGSITVGETNFRDKVEEPLKSVKGSAKEYLQKGMDELGISKAEDIKLTLLSGPQTDLAKAIAEFIQQEYKDELGITIDINYAADSPSYFNARTNGEYDLMSGGWSADYIDPSNYLSIFLTGGGNNSGKYSNSEYDSLVQKANTSMDESERLELYKKAEKILVADDPAIIPNYYSDVETFTKNNVKGYAVPLCNGYYILADIYMIE